MTDLKLLLCYSFRKVRGPAIALWALLFGLQILMAMVARTFEISGQFSEMARFIPEFIRPMLDPSFMAALSFSGMVNFGYSHVIVILLLTSQSIAAGTEPAGEIEAKFIDLLAARPVPRALLVLRSAGLVVLLSLAAVGSMVAGSVTALALLKPESAEGPPFSVTLSLAVNLAILVIAWGGIALCFAAFTNRRDLAAAGTGLIAFALFIVDFTGRLWEPIDSLAVLSPFRYYAPFPLITGESVPLIHIFVLAGIFVVTTSIALVAYQKRDL